MDIQMEERHCRACGKIIRVMTSSKQVHCSGYCFNSGVLWQGIQQASKLETLKLSESSIKPTRPSEPAKSSGVRLAAWPGKLKLTQSAEPRTLSTVEPSKEPGHRKEEILSNNKLTQKQESDMQTLPMMKQENKMSGDKNENPIELYEHPSETFKKEFFESTNVLNESVRLLHTQTQSLLKKPESELRNVDLYNMEQARANMNTIAKLIQTKVNFIKVLR